MHLRSLSLRNYRVYRSVDLEFPDGLIGIYGPNGSGKSTLIESLRWAIYGDSRTDKWELRTAGVGEDVRVELVFEHEGNTYDVRRRLKGRNLTPEVEVFLNGQLAAQSVREANAYLARVVGMDQRAFLASVCAQQKELTAFATMLPSDRRRLVLDLLGVSPVERALAKVREQARDTRTVATGARAGLPDLAELEVGADQAEQERRKAEQDERDAAAAEAWDGRGPGHRRAGHRHRRAGGQGAGGAAGQGRPGQGRGRGAPPGGRAPRGQGGRGRPARTRDRGRHRQGGRAGHRGRPPARARAGPGAGGRPGQPGHRPRGGQGPPADQRAGPPQGRGGTPPGPGSWSRPESRPSRPWPAWTSSWPGPGNGTPS